MLPHLRKKSDVRLFLHEGGKGEGVLKNAGEQYEIAQNASRTVETEKLPDLLVTSMCSEGGLGRDLIPICRELGIPTAAIQDMWGMRMAVEYADAIYHPDLLCVNDVVGARIVNEVWETSLMVAITGYPRLDALAHFDRTEAAEQGRQFLKITDDLPIVFYPGQIYHAGQTLRQIATALRITGAECHLVVSKHARMSEDLAPGENERWEIAQSLFHTITLTDFSRVNEVISASAVVVGQYSTIQIDAAAMGKQVISVLYPEYGGAEFVREIGGIVDEFPLVSLGCTAVATNQRELVGHLNQALSDRLNLRSAQEEAFKLDGLNAQRTAEAILSLVS